MPTTIAQLADTLKPADAIAERNCLITILATYAPPVQREIWLADLFTTNGSCVSAACDRLDPNMAHFEHNKSARIRILIHALNWINDIADAYIHRTAAQEEPTSASQVSPIASVTPSAATAATWGNTA